MKNGDLGLLAIELSRAVGRSLVQYCEATYSSNTNLDKLEDVQSELWTDVWEGVKKDMPHIEGLIDEDSVMELWIEELDRRAGVVSLLEEEDGMERVMVACVWTFCSLMLNEEPRTLVMHALSGKKRNSPQIVAKHMTSVRDNPMRWFLNLEINQALLVCQRILHKSRGGEF